MKPKRKFMQQMTRPMLATLKQIAREKQIPLQELLRAVIIPDWIEKEKSGKWKDGKDGKRQ